MAVVGAQVRDSLFTRRDELQADDLGREPYRWAEVGRPGPDIGDVSERDHGA